MYKIGLSSCGFKLTEENFKKLKKSKIDCIEISMLWDKYKDINYKQLQEFSTRYEIGGYTGPWMYEIGLECPDTITRDRNLTFDDFYNNAMSIFTQKKPTALGIPKENLGGWR